MCWIGATSPCLLLPSQADLGEFLAGHRVEIVASLPSYRASQTDAQRGEGVFEKSVEALQLLNKLGYGHPDSGLTLNLVCNPVGAFLPPKQEAIEVQFRKELLARHGIEFNHLYTITNMPISRFLEFLLESGNYEQYMERLANAFNPTAAAGVMCRYTISVSWDGTLYDCDFNQMLDLPIDHGAPAHIRDFDPVQLNQRRDHDAQPLLRLYRRLRLVLRGRRHDLTSLLISTCQKLSNGRGNLVADTAKDETTGI